jgi:hypothetical protein
MRTTASRLIAHAERSRFLTFDVAPRLLFLTTAGAEIVAARFKFDDALLEEVSPART